MTWRHVDGGFCWVRWGPHLLAGPNNKYSLSPSHGPPLSPIDSSAAAHLLPRWPLPSPSAVSPTSQHHLRAPPPLPSPSVASLIIPEHHLHPSPLRFGWICANSVQIRPDLRHSWVATTTGGDGDDNVFMKATMATTTVTTTTEMTTIKAMAVTTTEMTTIKARAVTRAGGAPNACWWGGGRRRIAVATQ